MDLIIAIKKVIAH